LTDKQLAATPSLKGLSIFIAILFVFNLFAVVPLSTQHSKIEGITHTISVEVANSDQFLLEMQHDNLEHCGLSSCTFSFHNLNVLTVNTDAMKTVFSTLTDDLASVFHPPLGRPPLI